MKTCTLNKTKMELFLEKKRIIFERNAVKNLGNMRGCKIREKGKQENYKIEIFMSYCKSIKHNE